MKRLRPSMMLSRAEDGDRTKDIRSMKTCVKEEGEKTVDEENKR